jgi:uncharacterized glyoxalase superfamily protein PhnB
MGMISFGIGISVNNIMEAVKFYKSALGMELRGTDHFPENHPNCGECMHAEMWKDGKQIFAIQGQNEKQRDYDPEKQIINFGAYFDTKEELREAFDLLNDGGIVKEPFGTVQSYSPCCATVIDRYGITWWISL